MALLPDTPKDAPITWLEARIQAWTDNAAAIGLSSEQIAQMGTLISAARGSYQNALQQRQIAKDSTRTQNEAIADMRQLATALIATIKAFADATDDENVYNLAQFDPPAPPSPSADPVPPTDIELSLRPQGIIDVKWKGSVAQGTTYEVQRQIGGVGAWTSIGTVPARSLSDAGVPAGSAQVGYRMRAVKPAAGPGNTDAGPRYSSFTSTQTIYLGVPENQVGGQVVGSISPATGPTQQAG
ncbi:MAG: hypothetical protein AAFV77_08850 [Planctomycetota bacterium]